MKVLKFGGTSVGTPESLRSVRAIVESQSEPVVVTVSALGGITDRLLKTAGLAVSGDDSYLRELEGIAHRHFEVIESVVPGGHQGDCWNGVRALLEELNTIIKAISLLGELTERSKDLVVSYGERMSCLIVTSMISGAKLAHSLEFIRTHRRYGKSVLDQERTSALVAEKFGALKEEKTIVVPGFISRDEEGKISNLGRGGSDYTAAILAAELNARELEIWTDVDGFMSADPRVVKDARIIEQLSFTEAMELCNFGAKVVYPPTIYPVFHKNIPIRIKNTFNPSAPGTLIAENCGRGDEHEILGVSAIADTSLIELDGEREGDYERMINALARNGIETLMPDGRRSCGVRGTDTERAREILNDKFATELISGEIKGFNIVERLAMPAIIGRRQSVDSDDTSRLASALNLAGIPLARMPQQAAPGTIACMLPADELKNALNVIHQTFINKK